MNEPPDSFAADRIRKQFRLAGVVFVLVVGTVIGACLWLRPHGPLRTAENTKDATENIRQIMQSCAFFASDHDDHFPKSLAELLDRGLRPAALMFPLDGPQPTTATTAAEIDARSAFIYTGAGVEITDAPSIIMLYTRGEISPGKRLVAFADGRVEEVSQKDLAPYFEQNNAARATAGRPKITLNVTTPHS